MNTTNEVDIFTFFRNKVSQISEYSNYVFQNDETSFTFWVLLAGSIIFEYIGNVLIRRSGNVPGTLKDFLSFFLRTDHISADGNLSIIRVVQFAFTALTFPVVREKIVSTTYKVVETFREFYIENNFYLNIATVLAFITLIYFNFDKIRTNNYSDIIKTVYDCLNKPFKSLADLLDRLYGKIFTYFDFRLFLSDRNIAEAYRDYPNLEMTFKYINVRWAFLLAGAANLLYPKEKNIGPLTFSSYRLYNIFMLGIMKISTDAINLMKIDFLKVLPTWKFDVSGSTNVFQDYAAYDKISIESRANSVFLETLRYFGIKGRENAYMCWYDGTINFVYKIIASAVSYYDAIKNFILSFIPDVFIDELKIIGGMLGYIIFWLVIIALLKYYLSTETDEIISSLARLTVHEKTVVANSYITRFFEAFYIAIYNNTIEEIKTPYLDKLNVIFRMLDSDINKDLVFVSTATNIINTFYGALSDPSSDVRGKYLEMLDDYLTLLNSRIPEIRQQVVDFSQYYDDLTESIKIILLLRYKALDKEIDKTTENMILSRVPKNYVPLLNFAQLEHDLITLSGRYRSDMFMRLRADISRVAASYPEEERTSKLLELIENDDDFRLRWAQIYSYVGKGEATELFRLKIADNLKILQFTNDEIYEYTNKQRKLTKNMINTRYRQLSNKLHPDKNREADTETFNKIVDAKTFLSKIFKN